MRAFDAYHSVVGATSYIDNVPAMLSLQEDSLANSWIPGLDLYLVLEAIGVIGAMRQGTSLTFLYNEWLADLTPAYSSLRPTLQDAITRSARQAWVVAQQLCKWKSPLRELTEIISMAFPSASHLRPVPAGIYPGIYLDLAMALRRFCDISHPVLEDMVDQGAPNSNWIELAMGKGYERAEIEGMKLALGDRISDSLQSYMDTPILEEAQTDIVLSHDSEAARDHAEY